MFHSIFSHSDLAQGFGWMDGWISRMDELARSSEIGMCFYASNG